MSEGGVVRVTPTDRRGITGKFTGRACCGTGLRSLAPSPGHIVVALTAAAPASAASPCQLRFNYRLNWGVTSYTRANFRSSYAMVSPLTVGGSQVRVDFTSVSSTTANVPDQNRNLTVPVNTTTNDSNLDPVVTNLGGVAGEKGMRLHHQSSTAGRANRQTVTIKFSRPVRGLSFAVTDIDSLRPDNQYGDRVEVSIPAGTTRSQSLSGIRGSGIQGDAWRRTSISNNNVETDINENVGENASTAKVTVTYSGSDISQLELVYWNFLGGSQYHRIFLSDFTFSAVGRDGC